MAGKPATEGRGYGHEDMKSNEAKVIASATGETGNILIRADPTNSSPVYIGWDDEVTPSSGMILEAGDTFNAELDSSQQSIYGIGGQGGEIVRWMATN